MNALQERLVTVLRNMDALVTAADVRARCQLPQELGVIDSNLRGLCRMGKALEVPPGRYAHRDYRLRPADASLPPPADPDPVPEEKPTREPVQRVRGTSKTAHVLQVLQERATSLSAAMTAEQISNALRFHLDPNTVSSILCTRRAAGKTPALVSHKAADGKLWWAWVEDVPAPASQPEPETPQQEPAMADNNNDLDGVSHKLDALKSASVNDGVELRKACIAAMAASVDIPTLSCEVPSALPIGGDIDKELAVMLAIDEMARRIDGHQVRDRDLKVAVLGKLAAISLPAVAALLQRIIDEDLAASEA